MSEHRGVICDACGKDLRGVRWACLDCDTDYGDACGDGHLVVEWMNVHADGNHVFVRLKDARQLHLDVLRNERASRHLPPPPPRHPQPPLSYGAWLERTQGMMCTQVVCRTCGAGVAARCPCAYQRYCGHRQ